MKILEVDLAANPYAVRLIADSALTLPGKPTFIPDLPEVASWMLKPYIAVRISRLGKCIALRFADRYHDSFTPACRLVPIDSHGSVITAIDSVLDFGVTIGRWSDHPVAETVGLSFSGADSHIDSRLHPDTVRQAIQWVSRLATLKMGDILLLPLDAADGLSTDGFFPATEGTRITASADSARLLTLRLL